MAKGTFKRTLKWKSGDLFAVPLSDGTYGYAQAIAPVLSWAIDFALLSVRTQSQDLLSTPLAAKNVIACQATWRQTLTGGYWAKVGNFPLFHQPEDVPNQKLLLHSNGIGTTHFDIAVIENFLSAYHGLLPWNMYLAHNFDSYLLPGVPRPATAHVLTPVELALYQQANAAGSLKQ